MTNSCLILSDTHYHNFPTFGGQRIPEGTSVYDESTGDLRFPGCNQRAVRLFNATERAFAYAKKREIDTVFHLGDVFHTKANVPLAVLNGATKIYRAAQADGIKCYALPGNHDYAGKTPKWTTLHTLFPMSAMNTSQAPDLRLVPVGEFTLAALMIPYMASKAAILSAFEEFCPRVTEVLESGEATHSALFMHVSVAGASVGPHEYVMKEGLKLSEIPFQFFNTVISGHYHKHQRLQKGEHEFIYAGAIAQHNFGERDYTPGYLRLDFTPEGISVVQIENKKSPRFHSLVCSTRDDLNQLAVDMQASMADGTPDYVHVDWQGGVYPSDVDLPEEWVIVEKSHTSALVKPRIEVSLVKDTPESLVEKYVSMTADPEDYKDLVNLGLNLMHGEEK